MPPKKAVGGGQSEGWACPPCRISFCTGKVTRGRCPLAMLPTSVGWHFLAGSGSPAVGFGWPGGVRREGSCPYSSRSCWRARKAPHEEEGLSVFRRLLRAEELQDWQEHCLAGGGAMGVGDMPGSWLPSFRGPACFSPMALSPTGAAPGQTEDGAHIWVRSSDPGPPLPAQLLLGAAGGRELCQAGCGVDGEGASGPPPLARRFPIAC